MQNEVFYLLIFVENFVGYFKIVPAISSFVPMALFLFMFYKVNRTSFYTATLKKVWLKCRK